jgi:hypothetical protein
VRIGFLQKGAATSLGAILALHFFLKNTALGNAAERNRQRKAAYPAADLQQAGCDTCATFLREWASGGVANGLAARA